MPTYDYECSECDHKFELFQQMSDSVKRKCPECGKNRLKRLIGTGAGIIFKGGGFYETDYRSDSYKKAAAEDKKSSDSGASDTQSSKDTKKSKPEPATKKDSKPAKKKDTN
jgi:putative FmdB family regulatory protein